MKLGIWLIIIGSIAINVSEAVTVYHNEFSSPESLDDFQVYGETFATYTPPPLHTVSTEAGQLRIDTDYLTPNGPGQPPLLLGHALLSLDASTSFNPGYNTTLSQNAGLISWSFNVSNQDGDYNCYFQCVLASTMENANDANAKGYSFLGGGAIGNQMFLKRFDSGLSGAGDLLIDVSNGLGALPDKGSFNITYNPATDEWSLFGETGSEYVDPTQVDSLLGTAIDSTYTDTETKYSGLRGGSTGAVFFDNLNVDVIPEAGSFVLILGIGILRKIKRVFFPA